jgi:hypothetical protein
VSVIGCELVGENVYDWELAWETVIGSGEA